MDVYAFMEIYVYGKVAAVEEYISLQIQNRLTIIADSCFDIYSYKYK